VAPISGKRGKKGAERVSEGFLLIDRFCGVLYGFFGGVIRVLGVDTDLEGTNDNSWIGQEDKQQQNKLRSWLIRRQKDNNKTTNTITMTTTADY